MFLEDKRIEDLEQACSPRHALVSSSKTLGPDEKGLVFHGWKRIREMDPVSLYSNPRFGNI